MGDFQDKRALIDQTLATLIPEKNVLFEAARYSLLAPAKRIRPILTLATVEAFGQDPDKALLPACALEMVHTYSLIHDDLPCMDDDDFRRGKPSLHKAYPEAHAVLAGDFLLTRAFETLATAPKLTAEQKLELIRILSQQSGGEGMIAGQVLDLEGEGKKLSLQQLQTIHSLKTGCLISASVQFGGVIANCNTQEMECLDAFAKSCGLAFQIVDDVIDITDSVAKHGKKISSDQLKKKSTYVSLLGLDGAKEEAQKLISSALKTLRSLNCTSTLLEKIAQSIVQRMDI